MQNDVNEFCMRHFPPSPSLVLPSPSPVLPSGMVAVAADFIDDLNRSCDAIQRRINSLLLTRVNFVRSRTGIVFRVDTWSKLQKQLARAERALAAERSDHKSTEEFLQHQNNARADDGELIERLRAEVEELRAQSSDGDSEIGEEDAQTEGAAADEIVSPPAAPQAEDPDPQSQTAGESAETIARLTKELEELRAECEEVEGQRDIWRDRFEEEELKEMEWTEDKESLERRVGDLESELSVERTSREEAQAAVVGLRDRNEKLGGELNVERTSREEAQAAAEGLRDRNEKLGDELNVERTSRGEAQAALEGLRDRNGKLGDELKELKAQHESLRTAYQAEERANEAKAAELSSLQADHERLQAEVTALRQGASTSPLNGSAPEFVPSSASSSVNNQPRASPQPTRPSHSWADEVNDPSEFLGGIPDFEISDSFVEDPFHGADPFPDIIIPEPTPAPSATGPGQARNAHVQKLNKEMGRRAWRERSGMAGSAEEEEGQAGPADVLDDMFERQVTQALSSPLTRYARGSMFGALNDVPTPVESLSAASTPSRRSHGSVEGATAGAGMPIMLGQYEVTRADPAAGSRASSSEAREEEEGASADGGLAGVEGGEEGDGPEEPQAEEEEEKEEEARGEGTTTTGHEAKCFSSAAVTITTTNIIRPTAAAAGGTNEPRC